MIKKIIVIKDLLFIKTILMFCTFFLTLIFILFYLIHVINGIELLIIFAPSVFFTIIYFFVKVVYKNQKKEEVQLYDKKIVIYKNKKQYIYQWKEIINTNTEKLFFGTDSLIMDFLIHIILKPYFINYKISFNSENEVNEIVFCISKSQLKKIQKKISEQRPNN